MGVLLIALVSDPNVDVIYVSPVTINDETLQYYNKLLGLRSAVESGTVESQKDMSSRFTIIIPESVNSFPVSIRTTGLEPSHGVFVFYGS